MRDFRQAFRMMREVCKVANILVCDDDKDIVEAISIYLEQEGYTVLKAYDGVEAINALRSQSVDLLIIDIIMPGMNGLELCRLYRRQYGYLVPVIMLTALGTTEDIVKGLDAGADDYLVKPFSFQELEARIKAILRRGREDSARQLVCDDLVLNCNSRRARRGEAEIDLTVKEYRLLEYFMTHQGLVLSRLTLLRDVWDKNFDTNTNVVDVYVNYLRGKIDKDFSKKLIHTVVGSGYIMYA